MKKYKPSQELADIFIKNGFIENTKIKYPLHFNRIVNNGYTPSSVKRSFSFKSNDSVIFDYLDLKPYYRKKCNSTDIKMELSENEIKSLITFFLLPSQHKSTYKKIGNNILDLHNDYKYFNNNKIKLTKYQESIISTFESVKL